MMLSLVKMIKSLRETNENLKAQLIDRSTLKLSDTLTEMCIPAMTIFLSWILKKLLSLHQGYPKMIIQEKFTGHASNWRNTEQRYMKSMPRYEIVRVSRKNWTDQKLLSNRSTINSTKFWIFLAKRNVRNSWWFNIWFEGKLTLKKWFNKSTIFSWKCCRQYAF